MAKQPITTEEFHAQLVGIITDITAKALRGDSLQGIEWEDADRIIRLVLTSTAEAVSPATTDADGREFSFYLSLGITDDALMDDDASLEIYAPISRTIIEGAEKRGCGAEFVREYREYVVNSLAKLDEWLAANEA